MKLKIGDIISIRVKVKSITEDDQGFKYSVKALNGDYNSLTIGAEDVIATNLQVPTESEE